MIRNMSSEEANIFSDLCRYVMQSGDIYYIDATGFFARKMEMKNVGNLYEKGKRT